MRSGAVALVRLTADLGRKLRKGSQAYHVKDEHARAFDAGCSLQCTELNRRRRSIARRQRGYLLSGKSVRRSEADDFCSSAMKPWKSGSDRIGSRLGSRANSE